MRKTLAAILLLFALSLCAPVIISCQSGGVSIETQHHAGNPNVRVWVNTNSHVYHCPGTRWYGQTKQGEYMTQKEAQDKGNRPAYGKPCE